MLDDREAYDGDDDDDDGGDGDGDAGVNSNVVDDNVSDNESGSGIVDGGGGGGAAAAAVVGAADRESDGGGGGAAAAAAVGAADRRFLLSTNGRSLSANGGVIRLRAVVVVVAVAVADFALSNRSSSLSLSYASRSCTCPLCIYRRDNKRHTSLITVSKIVLICISTGYGRSDRVCRIERPLHFLKPFLQRYDNPTQDVHDKTERRYVILIFR